MAKAKRGLSVFAWLCAIAGLFATATVAQAKSVEIFDKTVIIKWSDSATGYIYVAPTGHIFLTNSSKDDPHPKSGAEFKLGKVYRYTYDDGKNVHSRVSHATWSGQTLILNETDHWKMKPFPGIELLPKQYRRSMTGTTSLRIGINGEHCSAIGNGETGLSCSVLAGNHLPGK